MASGVPFISTDVGCVRFFPGGVLVRNKDEMAYWLETLMSDERLRSSLGKMGAEYARKHMTVEAKVLELEKILKGTHNE